MCIGYLLLLTPRKVCLRIMIRGHTKTILTPQSTVIQPLRELSRFLMALVCKQIC